MNELTINNMELTERAADLVKRISRCLESITTRTSELTIYFNEIIKEGVEQKALVEMTGLSKSTISKMLSTSELYITFFLNYFPDEFLETFDMDFIISDRELMSIPYSKMYLAKDIITDSDSLLYKLTYNEAIVYLRNVKVVNNAISCEDTSEVDEDTSEVDEEEVVEKENKIDSVSDSEYVNIKVHKDNVDLLIYLLTDVDSDYSFLTKDLVKQLEKAI